VLPDTSVVVGIESRASFSSPAEVGVFAAPDAQTEARAVLDLLSARAVELNPYRGRILRASDQGGLSLSVIELPQLTRENVIVPERVWAEIDLGLTAVRDLHAELNRHGLGTRRGLLLAGPPGTGKSAVSAVVANEVVGDLTVIYVEARAGARLLTAVVEESQQLAPACVILEDVDLWCRDRSVGGGGLSELLQAMDIRSDARILTLASTNDVATLDKAAVRAGRFDAIVEVGFPDGASAARILTTLIADLPGGDQVDTAAVAAALPPQATGADIREIVRRAFLGSGGGGVRTAALLAEIGCGRYRPELPGGTYL
jgi:DNA-binding Lrp family transcriptional regulator